MTAIGVVPRLFQTAPWVADALCRGSSELFFPERGESPAPAKAICAACPVKAECLDWALDNHETGIWGGTTQRERMLIRRRPQRHNPNNCGTESGSQSHRYYGEPVCPACLVAARQAQRRRLEATG